jgi:hypothetical protein
MQSAIEAAERELDDALDAAREAYSDKELAAPSGPGFSAEQQRALDAFAAKLRAGRERGGRRNGWPMNKRFKTTSGKSNA